MRRKPGDEPAIDEEQPSLGLDSRLFGISSSPNR
jgi:hypothetical protein